MGFISERQRRYVMSGFRVRRVPGAVMQDYAGMNHYAAKRLEFTPQPKEDVIIISGEQKGRNYRRTAYHEALEARLMRQGHSYWFSHKQALKAEKKVR